MPIPICMNPRGCIKYEPIDRTPFTVTALEDNCTVTLAKQVSDELSYLDLYYRLGDETSWHPYTLGTTIELPEENTYVQFWNKSYKLNETSNSTTQVRFNIPNKTKLSGNINSLINYSRNCTYSGCFRGLFASSTNKIYDASELILPSQRLTSFCYCSLFYNNYDLKYPVAILPAKKLAWQCYSEMYVGCSSLNIASDMLATKMESYCCFHMYSGARLTSIRIRATELAELCFHNFFGSNTIQLEQIEVDFTDWYEDINATNSWISYYPEFSTVDPNSYGTFIKPQALPTIFDKSDPKRYYCQHIPPGWTVINK